MHQIEILPVMSLILGIIIQKKLGGYRFLRVFLGNDDFKFNKFKALSTY